MKIRIIVFVALALVTIAGCKFFSRPASTPEAGIVVWLPESYDHYLSDKIPISEQEKKWLPKDTTNYKRRYVDRHLRQQVEAATDLSEERKDAILNYHSLSATLIVAGSDSRSLHNPKVCLTAQSWTIKQKKVVIVETSAGPLEVMNFYLEKVVIDQNRNVVKNPDGSDRIQEAIYTFWWIGPNNTTPHIEERIWASLWNSVLSGKKERWAYPSFMIYVNDEVDGMQKAQERINDFVKRFSPRFQKSLGAEEREDAIQLYNLEGS
jgi:hypothetical protein